MTTVLGPPLFLGAVYAFIALPGDPSWGNNLTTHSRAGFAVMTLLGGYPTSAVLGVQPLMFGLFLDQYLRGPPDLPAGGRQRR